MYASIYASRLRRINLILFVLTALLVVVFIRTRPAAAQVTPFLYRPYYGAWPGYTAWIDHKGPLSGVSGVFHNNRGEEAQSYCNINLLPTQLGRYQYCYDNHEGLDYPLSYLPVVASAPGYIEYAGWQNNVNREAGLGLMVRINHNNNYKTQYGHLSMIRLQTGTNTQRWQIGTSGTTGRSSGPHLHFDVNVLSGGIWWYTDPLGYTGGGGDPLTPDSSYLFVADPTQTRPARGTEYYVDDGDAGYYNSCNSGGNFWWVVNGFGYANDLRYTHSNGTAVDCTASWRANLPSTGQYEVEVFVPNWHAASRTHAARYWISHNGGQSVVVVDQHRVGTTMNTDIYQIFYPADSGGQWISLGRYDFTANSPSLQLYVQDATFIGGFVEPASPNTNILVDAMRLVRTH